MSSENIFLIIVIFLCLDFILERILEHLNFKHMSPVLPDNLRGIYDEKEYERLVKLYGRMDQLQTLGNE